MVDLATARNLISEAVLPPIMAFAADAPPSGGGLPDFDPAKEQSVVIGSDVVSFGTGVDAKFRQAISDCALFAQLRAQHMVGADADPMAFFDAYFETMMGLGWIEQSRETDALDVEGSGLDVHEAIIGVVSGFLAPIAGAGAAVLAVLNGLHQMDSKAPFITLFNKRSVHQKIGKFQFTYVHSDANGGLLAQMAAFGLVASQVVTQVLFFKLKDHSTSLRKSLGLLSIDPATLDHLRPNLAAKVLAYRQSLIAEAELGPVEG